MKQHESSTRHVRVAGALGLAATLAFGVATSAGPAAGSTVRSRALTDVTLAESVVNITDLPIWVAQEKGYFVKHGLNVKVVVLTTSTVTPALVSGSVQFIKDPGFTFVTSKTQNAPIEAISKFDSGLPFALVVSKPFASAHHITSATPLARVMKAIPGSMGGATAAGQVGAANLLFRSFGIQPSGYRSTIFATVPAMVTALDQGSINWMVAAQPIPLQAQAAGYGYVVASSANAKPWAAQPADFVLAASTSYAKSHPAVAKAMTAAIDEALVYVAHHEQKCVSIVQPYVPKVTRPDLLKSIQALKWATSGSMNRSYWKSSLAYYVKAGILPHGTNVQVISWTNAYVSRG